MWRRWLQWRLVAAHERILTKRLLLQIAYARKSEIELELQGRVLAEQIEQYTKELEVSNGTQQG